MAAGKAEGHKPGLEGDNDSLPEGEKYDENTILQLAASLERHSEHADRRDARAIVRGERFVLQMIREPRPHRGAEVVLAKLVVRGRCR